MSSFSYQKRASYSGLVERETEYRAIRDVLQMNGFPEVFLDRGLARSEKIVSRDGLDGKVGITVRIPQQDGASFFHADIKGPLDHRHIGDYASAALDEHLSGKGAVSFTRSAIDYQRQLQHGTYSHDAEIDALAVYLAAHGMRTTKKGRNARQLIDGDLRAEIRITPEQEVIGSYIKARISYDSSREKADALLQSLEEYQPTKAAAAAALQSHAARRAA